jgi:proliferating cell nuclear antigen
MFKMALDYSVKIKSVLEMLNSLTDAVTMEITSEGPEIKCLDESHITFISINVPKKVFTNFKTSRGDKERFGLDIGKFQELINLAQKDDLITLEKEDNLHELTISFENEDKRIFKLPSSLLESEIDEPPVFDDEGYVRIEIPQKLFKNEIDTLNEVSTGYSAQFTIDKEKLIIQTKPSMDKTGGLVEYRHGKSVSKTVKSVYSLERLSHILKAETSDIIYIEMDDDMPMKLKSEFKNGGELIILLAPRIEDY